MGPRSRRGSRMSGMHIPSWPLHSSLSIVLGALLWVKFSTISPMVREIGVGGFVVSTLARRYVNEVLDSSRLSYGPFHRRFLRRPSPRSTTPSIPCSATRARARCRSPFRPSRRSTVGPTATRLSSRRSPSSPLRTSSYTIAWSRCSPMWIPLTYTLDPAKFEAAITPKTRAVIPVHLLGLPTDMDPIITVARERGLSIIEDSAETMFARYKGRKVGSLGDIGCFSTYIAHYIVTGVGGFATTSDPDLQVRLRSLMNHIATRSIFRSTMTQARRARSFTKSWPSVFSSFPSVTATEPPSSRRPWVWPSSRRRGWHRRRAHRHGQAPQRRPPGVRRQAATAVQSTRSRPHLYALWPSS